MFKRPSGRVIASSDVPEKALPSMRITVSGTTNEVNAKHPENIPSRIDVIYCDYIINYMDVSCKDITLVFE